MMDFRVEWDVEGALLLVGGFGGPICDCDFVGSMVDGCEDEG